MNRSGSTGVIIPAAGTGTRFGEKKQFKHLGRRPLLFYAVRTFLQLPDVREMVVVVPESDVPMMQREIRSLTTRPGICVTAGGPRRQDSVANGLAQLSEKCTVVCVHDAARPFVSVKDIQRCLAACTEHTGAILAVPVRDTLKRVDEKGIIRRTVDREGLWQAQTPQCFPRNLLTAALQRAQREKVTGTDEAALVEALGGEITVVKGSRQNAKITTVEDWELATALIQYREENNHE